MVDGLSGDTGPRVVWSTELSSIAVLRHNPRFPLEAGRMLLGFVDGSLVRLWAGVLLPFAARRFAASFDDAVCR